jgi:hypothetical protein
MNLPVWSATSIDSLECDISEREGFVKFYALGDESLPAKGFLRLPKPARHRVSVLHAMSNRGSRGRQPGSSSPAPRSKEC